MSLNENGAYMSSAITLANHSGCIPCMFGIRIMTAHGVDSPANMAAVPPSPMDCSRFALGLEDSTLIFCLSSVPQEEVVDASFYSSDDADDVLFPLGKLSGR